MMKQTLWILSIAAWGCGSSGTTPTATPDAGSGATGGDVGSAGSSGSSGAAGAGGSSGLGGTSAAGGAAGIDGGAGASGSAGMGGESGAGSGGTAGASGTGGVSGTSGAGGSVGGAGSGGAGGSGSPVCVANQRFCDVDVVKLCAADGSSASTIDTCSSSQYCEAATASCQDQACTPGSPVCDGNRTTTCANDGSGAVSGGTPCETTQACADGACRERICTPSDAFCDATTGDARRCSADGLTSTLLDDCAATEWCDEAMGSAACKPWVCTPQQAACDGDVATTCNALGSGYASGGTACGAGGCRDGACAPPLFEETWEDLDTAGWSPFGNGNVTGGVQSTGGAAGSSAFLRLQRRSGLGYQEGLTRSFTSLAPRTVSWWARAPAKTKNTTFTLLFADAQATEVLVWHVFDDKGNVLLDQAPGPSVTVAAAAANTWMHFELRNVDWTAGTFDYWVDGTLRKGGAALLTRGSSIRRMDLTVFDAGHTGDWDQIQFR
jgi:hypothetical protein